MVHFDSWGLATTAPDHDALVRYESLVDGFLVFAKDLPQRLARAVEEPAAPMSIVTLGLLLVQANTAVDHRRAGEAADRARVVDLDDRERMHLEALDVWLLGDLDTALDIWDRLLLRWPTDALALRLRYFALFSQGRCAEMLSSSRRAIEHWDDRPRRSHLDGMVAFALEELGEYAEAERLGRAAVDADDGDLWSIHAVAHVLEMQARTDDGLAWFAGRDDVLHTHGSFARHLWWHHAIIHLRTGDHARLLELYDREIQPGDATDALSLTNAIDGLARLEFAGVDVGDRWIALVDPATRRLDHHSHPFADAHVTYALARAGADAEADRVIDGMVAWRDPSTTAGRVIDEVGLDTARAMLAIGRGRNREGAALLARTRDRRWKLGGSHAQRQVFELAEAFAAAV